MFTLAGQGTLCGTSLSVGSTNATAYAVKTAGGGMTIIIVNKDATQSLRHVDFAATDGRGPPSLMTMSQKSSGANRAEPVSDFRGDDSRRLDRREVAILLPNRTFLLSPVNGSLVDCTICSGPERRADPGEVKRCGLLSLRVPGQQRGGYA